MFCSKEANNTWQEKIDETVKQNSVVWRFSRCFACKQQHSEWNTVGIAIAEQNSGLLFSDLTRLPGKKKKKKIATQHEISNVTAEQNCVAQAVLCERVKEHLATCNT